MKSLALSFLALVLIVTGCSTPRTVSNLEGRGTKRSFDVPYDVAWRAAVDAAQQGELEVLNADRTRGYISARRGVQVETFGENVGLWVRSLGPTRSEVEVASRQAGPPVMWLKNWENEILRAVAANITRDAVGSAGSGTQTYRDAAIVTPVPGERTTIVIPEPSPRTTIVTPDTSTTVDARLYAQRRLEELRREQQAREADLTAAETETRRTQIRAEIDRLRAELRLQEERLNALEKEVK